MAANSTTDDFFKGLKSLLDSGKYSDFIITCHGKTWNVHKAIVCSQSDPLEAASRFGKEAIEDKIDLPEDDPEIVAHMLRFMYERDYRLPSEDVPGPHWTRLVWSRTDAAIEKKEVRIIENFLWEWVTPTYLLEAHPERKQTSNGKVLQMRYGSLRFHEFAEQIEAIHNDKQKAQWPVCAHDLSTHAKLYSIAEKYFVKGLKVTVREKFKACLNSSFAGKTFYHAAEIVFSTTSDTDTGLRELVAKRVFEEKEKYGLDANEDLNEALKAIPDLAYWVMRYEASQCQVAPRVTRS
ncbi:hypothetical protein EJ02DRAFT_368897 [Clathrospora elynae]|uniref:BTB domain-containing protein n=1 Tax=Clathrospora elynae TaxID=706981 RepID=A0A6A5SZ85_9PLEO|nr:hypothetical protein EJ02DRAFT_368897 [Clathrospora elynae]